MLQPRAFLDCYRNLKCLILFACNSQRTVIESLDAIFLDQIFETTTRNATSLAPSKLNACRIFPIAAGGPIPKPYRSCRPSLLQASSRMRRAEMTLFRSLGIALQPVLSWIARHVSPLRMA